MSRRITPVVLGWLVVGLALAFSAARATDSSVATSSLGDPIATTMTEAEEDLSTSTIVEPDEVPVTETTEDPRPCGLTNEPTPRSAASLAIQPPSSENTPLIDVDFDGLGEIDFGGVDRQLWSDLFDDDFEYYAGIGELSIVASRESPDGSELRQRYVPVETGSPVVETPTVDLVGAEEMWLSYMVYFEPGWEWVLGGKLPGLGGGTNPSGLKGGDGTDGFSARMSFGPEEHLAAYVYHPDREGTPGEVFNSCETFGPGTDLWITQRIVMNTGPESFDGLLEVWVNGEKQILVDDLRFRTTGDFNVDVFVYSSFYGGASEQYAPSTTTYARFDDFRVGHTPASVGFEIQLS